MEPTFFLQGCGIICSSSIDFKAEQDVEKSHTVLGGTALYRLHVNSWSVVENVIHSKGWSHNGVL